jgi:2-iminobutanoate/2-iminopropanoate deaminase
MNIKLLTLVIAANILTPVLTPVAAQAADAGRSYVTVDSSAARAQLPFSDAVRAGNTLYVSGTLGMDPSTLADPKTARVASDPADEARFALEAVKRTLEAAGYYATFNDVYRSFFHEHFPARAFIGVNKLVRGARFEVMGTAVKPGK